MFPIIIDVIILSFAKNAELKSLTEQSIKTLHASEDAAKIKFNVIVVESNKKLKPFEYADTKTIYPNTRFGFNKYLNIGLTYSNADYICLSNNDVIFSKRWASEILYAMQNDSTLLSASPICPVYHPNYGFNLSTGNHYGTRTKYEVAGWLILLKRNVLNIIGSLDEKIEFWFADNDYSNLLEQHNINHALVTTSVVQHLSESTSMSLDRIKQHKLMDGSFIYYDYKWNHKNHALYIKRITYFIIYNKLRRLKFWIRNSIIRSATLQMQAPKNKAVATVAISKEYLNYAINQYLCFNLFNHNSSEIDFVIITDCDTPPGYDNRNNLNIIKINPFLNNDEVLLHKLYIPELLPYERVIFLDADNLIAGDINILFNNFEKFAFVVFGENSDNTNWRYDIERLKNEFDLAFLPRINGCLFYYHKAAENVLPMFSFLKSLISSYDKLNLARVHGNLKDDEILLAIGCSKYNFTCLPNDGRYKAETMYYAKRRINIVKGIATLWNTNATLTIGNFNFPHRVRPLIVAFDRDSRYNFDYTLNIKLLKAVDIRRPYIIKLITIYSLHFRLMMAYKFKLIKDELHFYKTR